VGTKFSQLDAAGALAGTEVLALSKLSASITITAATISALASDNSYNDSGNGFVSAGFAVGQNVKVTGFTGDTANNIVSGRITVLTAGKMTIGGTDGDVIVDDAAGESVTITAWESKRSTAQDVADLASGTVAAPVALTDAATVATDASLSLVFDLLTTSGVGASRTMDEPTNLVDGMLLMWRIKQAASGGPYTVTWDAVFAWGSGGAGAAPTLSTTAGATDIISGIYDAGAGKIYAGHLATDAGIDGSTGSLDNAVLRANGTGGATLQSTGVVISDADEISGYLANVNLQTGTTYTVDVAGSDTDSGKIIDCNNGSAIAVTLPATAPVGFACTVVQAGAGQITFASTGSGTVVNRQSHTKTAGNKAMVALYVRANSGGSAAVWVLGGDTAT
jgi:hypothetical protein